MTRFVPVTVVMVVVLSASGVARAQGTTSGSTLPDGSTISFDKLYLHEDGNRSFAEPKMQPDSLWHYFNLAHCQCGKAMPNFVEATYGYLLTLHNVTAPNSHTLEIWVGSACDNETTRLMTCRQLTDQSVTPISSIQQTNGTTRTIPIYDAMNPETGAANCAKRAQDAIVWAIADGNGDGTRDFFVSKSVSTDSLPPPLPSDFRASGGDKAIVISWTPPVDTSDIYGYQALCMRADTSAPGKATDRPTRRYETASTLCGQAQAPSVDLGAGTDVPGASGGGTPITADNLPPVLKDLDPTFLCGEELSPTASSLRISGLENGVAYKVVLLAVDKFQNASGTFFTSTLTPVPATDFWEDLHDRGSKVDGGLCLLAETYGDDSPLTNTLRAFRDDTLGSSAAGRWLSDAYYTTMGKLGAYVHGSVVLQLIAAVVLAPLVVLALLWHWLTLPGLIAATVLLWLWCRRRRTIPRKAVRVAATTAAMTMLALLPGRARAGGYQPYWENSDPTAEQSEAAADDASLVTWHAGIRLGPYIPDIDKQFGMNPGPYQQMFHGAQVLPMLDVDRILWTGFGQIGIGGTVGYMQKSENQFADQSLASDANRVRVMADTNKFRLVPIAATATYRFTWFDDEFGIPVIPYVRGGLAYYLWWVNVSDGSLAQICEDRILGKNCHNKALGASLGVQGSIGLAIRAERVDASTAMSMRQSGIQHAGIYGELSLAKVDGFGSDTKLSVGDRTWFAGVDFEF